MHSCTINLFFLIVAVLALAVMAETDLKELDKLIHEGSNTFTSKMFTVSLLNSYIIPYTDGEKERTWKKSFLFTCLHYQANLSAKFQLTSPLGLARRFRLPDDE